MTTTLLLDSDIVAYQFASAAQENYDFKDTGVCIICKDLTEVTPLVDEWITALMKQLHADELIVCLSVPTHEGFRLKVLPSYKSNRSGTIRPLLLQPLKDHLANAYPSYIRPELEADDVMGILATHPTKFKGGMTIIVSEDKDMQTIPGLLFRPNRDTTPRFITTASADRYHMYQTLVGDAVDGYKGCHGIGPVKAERILDDALNDYWPSVVAAYEAKGLTEEDALVQARVARICRYSDYDLDKKEVKLWNPHTQQIVP
jgi:DNA polymerase-1